MQRLEQPIEEVDPSLRSHPELLGNRLLSVALVGALITAVMLSI